MKAGYGKLRQNAEASASSDAKPHPAFMVDVLPRYLDGSHRPGREIATWRACVLGTNGFFFLCSSTVDQHHPLAAVHSAHKVGPCVVMTWWTDSMRNALDFASEFGTGVFDRAFPLAGQRLPVAAVSYASFFRRAEPNLFAVFEGASVRPVADARPGWLGRLLGSTR